jgi:hypothetical protein
MTARSNGQDAPCAHGVPVGDVLGRAGHELAHLALLLEHLQMNIRPHVQETAARDPELLRHMQSVDHIAQKAAAIAEFLAALAHRAPRQWLVDAAAAAQSLTLAELASRLAFASGDQEANAAASGECDFF